MKVFNTVAALQEARLPANNQLVAVKGVGNYTIQASGIGLTLDNGTIAIPEVIEHPHIDQFGGKTSQSLSGADSSFDNSEVFDLLLSWVTANFYNGIVRLGSGYYRATRTVDCTMTIIFEGDGPSESAIHATHTTGPAVRFRTTRSGLRSCGVTGSAARGAFPAGSNNFGVLFEGNDVPEIGGPRLLYQVMEDYYIFRHADSGVHVVGPAFTGSFKDFEISAAGMHGISFDRGQATGRTNIITGTISGICPIQSGRINNCQGHAIALGSPTEAFSTPALRVIIDNIEGANNNIDPLKTYSDSPVYMRGANHTYMNSAIAVDIAGGAAATVAGRNIHLTNNRCLSNYAHAYEILTYDELPTDGIFIEGFSVIAPLAPLDPAVIVRLPAGEVIEPRNIFINQGEDANITRMIASDSTLGSDDYRRILGVRINGETPPIYKPADETVNNSASFQTDDDLRFWIAANETILFEFVIGWVGTNTADLRARVTAPAGATVEYSGLNSSQVSTTDTIAVSNLTAGGTLSLGSGSPTTQRVVNIQGYCSNGATAGFISLQWAQLVAEVSDTTVKAGISHLKITRLVS